MNRFARFLMTALLVLVVAGAGALAIGYRTGAIGHDSVLEVATTGDLRDLFAPHPATDSILVDLALRKLESDYYKPIDPQTPIAGENDIVAQRAAVQESLQPGAAVGNRQRNSQSRRRARGRVARLCTESLRERSRPERARRPYRRGASRHYEFRARSVYGLSFAARIFKASTSQLSGGNFGGIGVYIYQLKDGRIVVQPIEDMPAARAGMKPGEVVDSVDGRSVRGMNIDRVEALIRGEAGTMVRLRAHPYEAPSQERSYAIVREIIHVPDGTREHRRRYRRYSPIRFRHDLGRRNTQGADRRPQTTALAAIFSTFATTAAACSMPQSRSRVSSSRKVRSSRRSGATASARRRRARRRDRRPPSSRRAREQIYCECF